MEPLAIAYQNPAYVPPRPMFALSIIDQPVVIIKLPRIDDNETVC